MLVTNKVSDATFHDCLETSIQASFVIECNMIFCCTPWIRVEWSATMSVSRVHWIIAAVQYLLGSDGFRLSGVQQRL